MNSNTKRDLQDFLTKVQWMAQGCVHMIGVETAKDVMDAAEQLKTQLDKDETILDWL